MPPLTSARSHQKSAAPPHGVHGMMATRTAPRQARSAKSLDLILDAAERLLHERGVVETSTVDVAAAAGVSVGRLYYWFPDKDAVVRAVLARAEHRLRTLLVEMLVRDSTPPRVELVELLLRPSAGSSASTLARSLCCNAGRSRAAAIPGARCVRCSSTDWPHWSSRASRHPWCRS